MFLNFEGNALEEFFHCRAVREYIGSHEECRYAPYAGKILIISGKYDVFTCPRKNFAEKHWPVSSLG